MNQTLTNIISFKGGNGSSISDAIEIVGADNFKSGLQAEFEYIQSIYGEDSVEYAEGCTIVFTNAAIHHINIVTKTGDIKDIFFNVTEFQQQVENEDFEIVQTFSVIN